MDKLNVLEKIRNFSKDDNLFELNINDKIFIKYKHNNSIFLYSKSFYPNSLQYTVETKYDYAGVYNITTNNFFDLHYPLNLYVDKEPPNFKELRRKVLDEININVAKEMYENSSKYFEGLTVPEENRTTEEHLIERVNSDIFKGYKQELKEAGVWTFAAEAGGQDFWEADFHCPCAIVLGSEGNGVSRLVKERCDFLVSIPMYGKVNSLNVSTAASVLLCHAARKQRG